MRLRDCLVFLALAFAAQGDDVLCESNRDPPKSISAFFQQTYKAVTELGLDWEGKYPYDGEFTYRMFTEGAPTTYEVLAVVSLATAFILIRYLTDPLIKVR